MSKNNEQIAKEEAYLLWRFMAETGGDKRNAITLLYLKGVLSLDKYLEDCPLCEYYIYRNFGKGYVVCEGCMFYKKFRHCNRPPSPYYTWGFDPTQANAGAVADFIGRNK